MVSGADGSIKEAEKLAKIITQLMKNESKKARGGSKLNADEANANDYEVDDDDVKVKEALEKEIGEVVDKAMDSANDVSDNDSDDDSKRRRRDSRRQEGRKVQGGENSELVEKERPSNSVQPKKGGAVVESELRSNSIDDGDDTRKEPNKIIQSGTENDTGDELPVVKINTNLDEAGRAKPQEHITIKTPKEKVKTKQNSSQAQLKIRKKGKNVRRLYSKQVNSVYDDSDNINAEKTHGISPAPKENTKNDMSASKSRKRRLKRQNLNRQKKSAEKKVVTTVAESKESQKKVSSMSKESSTDSDDDDDDDEDDDDDDDTSQKGAKEVSDGNQQDEERTKQSDVDEPKESVEITVVEETPQDDLESKTGDGDETTQTEIIKTSQETKPIQKTGVDDDDDDINTKTKSSDRSEKEYTKKKKGKRLRTQPTKRVNSKSQGNLKKLIHKMVQTDETQPTVEFKETNDDDNNNNDDGGDNVKQVEDMYIKIQPEKETDEPKETNTKPDSDEMIIKEEITEIDESQSQKTPTQNGESKDEIVEEEEIIEIDEDEVDQKSDKFNEPPLINEPNPKQKPKAEDQDILNIKPNASEKEQESIVKNQTIEEIIEQGDDGADETTELYESQVEITEESDEGEADLETEMGPPKPKPISDAEQQTAQKRHIMEQGEENEPHEKILISGADDDKDKDEIVKISEVDNDGNENRDDNQEQGRKKQQKDKTGKNRRPKRGSGPLDLNHEDSDNDIVDIIGEAEKDILKAIDFPEGQSDDDDDDDDDGEGDDDDGAGDDDDVADGTDDGARDDADVEV